MTLRKRDRLYSTLLSALFLLSVQSQQVAVGNDGPFKMRNETIRLEMTQGFFNNLQKNIIIPLILNIDQLVNLTVDPYSFAGDLELFKIDGNMTGLHCQKFSIGTDTELIQLHDGFITFDMQKFILDFTIGYEFILDPPIMADIGNLSISIDNLQIKSNMTAFEANNSLQLNLTYLMMNADDFGIEFDGLNDFLYTMNNLINQIGGIIFGKVG